MEEVSTRVELHLVQLAYTPEVYHCAHTLSCNHLRITSTCVDGRKLTEGRADHGAHEKCKLLFFMQRVPSPELL